MNDNLVPKLKYRANLIFVDGYTAADFLCPIIEEYTLEDAISEAFGICTAGIACVGNLQHEGVLKTQVIIIPPDAISSIEMVEITDKGDVVFGKNPPSFNADHSDGNVPQIV